jgi:hypothetical protein
VQQHSPISVGESESTGSLTTDLPIALRGFLEFDSRYIAEERSNENDWTTEDMEDFGDRAADIVGSYQQSPLMDFIAWELLASPSANSVP